MSNENIQEQEPNTETAKEEKQEEKPVNLKQSELDKLVGTTRKEGRESARKELFEKAGVNSEKELLEIIAERKAAKEAEMTEYEKAKALAAEEAAKREALQSELNKINLEREFGKATKTLQIEYANAQAETDAIGYLISGGVTSETMEERLKQLAQERPYLLKTRQEKPEIDSKEKGTQVRGDLTEARKKELEQRIPPLRKT